MERSKAVDLPCPISVNGFLVDKIIIGDHYKEKHGDSVSDELIVSLVTFLREGVFQAESTSKGINYFVSDIEVSSLLGRTKRYRLIWLIEGSSFDTIGVVNAFRINRRR